MFLNPLVLMILAPVIAGISCLPFSDRFKRIPEAISLLVTFASLAGSVFVFAKRPLYWQAGPHLILAADTLSSFIGLGIAFFAVLITIYSLRFTQKDFGRYFGYLLITLGSSLAVAFTNDLIVLMTFWGVLAALLYLLVNLKGDDAAASSAKKAIIIIGGTDALLIFGIGLIWHMTGTFSIDKIHIPIKGALPMAAYLAIAAACLAKAGAMPFHSWLPDVAENAPTGVTAYLPASLDKLLGIYLLVRASMGIFTMNSISNLVLSATGSVTIILAVILALVQHDLKRLLGYHAVSQVGYMILGIGTGSAVGIAGGLFHMVNNAVYKTGLFLSAGAVEKSAGRTDLAKLGGLAAYMPVTFFAFLIASLSISGIPPFNGFVSKWMIYQGIIESAGARDRLWVLWLASAMFGSMLTVASFIKLIYSVFLGKPSAGLKAVKEAPFAMVLPLVILALICILFGVFAFLVPIPVFIAPSLGLDITFMGTWVPVAATALIIIGVLAGFFVYPLLKAGSFRRTDVFVGGEEADEYRVSGVEFYNTIKDVKALDAVYRNEEKGALDIFSLGRNVTRSLAGFLKGLHNGILPTYMVWCLLGLAAMLLIILF